MSSEPLEASDNERFSPTVCFLCRQRKTKCDRRLPRCGFCIKAKVECQYVERSKKRGLRAGYVSELETRIEILEHEMQGLKNAQRTPIIARSAPASRSSQSPNFSIRDGALHVPDLPDRISGQFESHAETESAIHDMMSLPRAFFHHLVDLWFKETQMWVPIFNREHLNTSLEALPTPVSRIDDVELRALVAFKISYSTQAICLGYVGRRRLSRYLRSQVLVDSIAKPSMSSLRALLIISLLDYGSDDIPSTFSLLAVCRRMSENIGTFRQLLKRIEGESPAQVGPPAVQMPSGDDTIPLTWCILAFDAASTLGISWRDVSAALTDHLSSIAFISTPDFRDSFRTHTHLAAIGLQPVHEFFSAQARYANLIENPMETCEEMYQNLIGYVDGLPETSYTLLADGAIDFDICQIFTKVLSHGTIIMIYQRFVFDEDKNITELSRSRCLASCAAMINTIRSLSDSDTEINNSPVFGTLTFVAARLKIVMYRALDHAREPSFDILMHGLNMLGRRWQLARRLDIVLRAALVELDTGIQGTLPTDFWELKKSHLDISETLKTWVAQHTPSLYVGNLDGPYV